MSVQDIVNGRGAGGSSGSVFSGSMSDAFGRLRMSNPETLFDSKQTTSNQPLYFDDAEIQGSGTSSTYLTEADNGASHGVSTPVVSRWFFCSFVFFEKTVAFRYVSAYLSFC